MSGLALVPAWFWIALGTVLALAGLVVGVWKSRGRAYRPEHRLRARDVVAVTEAEGRDFYGSMTLDGERDLYPLWPPARWLAAPADPVPWEDLQSDARMEDGPDWREQTAADLAPEALDDPGPGGAPSLVGPVPPGPDQFMCIYCERETPNGPPCSVCGWDRCAECGRCIDQPAHDLAARERLADTEDIAAAHHAHPAACPRCGSGHREPHCADGYEWGPWPSPDLERLAWLDQQLDSFFDWARWMRGQSTGWGLEVAA